MAALDADLVTALKLAKSRKMFFAFVPKGSDGKLILSKIKIPAKDIADAKKDIAGGSPVVGTCTGPISALVFEVGKAAPATMPAALKRIVKRDAGINIVPDVQKAGD